MNAKKLALGFCVLAAVTGAAPQRAVAANAAPHHVHKTPDQARGADTTKGANLDPQCRTSTTLFAVLLDFWSADATGNDMSAPQESAVTSCCGSMLAKGVVHTREEALVAEIQWRDQRIAERIAEVEAKLALMRRNELGCVKNSLLYEHRAYFLLGVAMWDLNGELDAACKRASIISQKLELAVKISQEAWFSFTKKKKRAIVEKLRSKLTAAREAIRQAAKKYSARYNEANALFNAARKFKKEASDIREGRINYFTRIVDYYTGRLALVEELRSELTADREAIGRVAQKYSARYDEANALFNAARKFKKEASDIREGRIDCFTRIVDYYTDMLAFYSSQEGEEQASRIYSAEKSLVESIADVVRSHTDSNWRKYMICEPVYGDLCSDLQKEYAPQAMYGYSDLNRFEAQKARMEMDVFVVKRLW